MPIDSSSTLLGSGPATALDRCFILGVGSTSAKVKELVTGVERDIAFSGSASRGSDANGAYINSAAATDYATITDDFNPSGNSFTIGFVFDPATLNPADWAPLFAWVNSSNQPFAQVYRYSNANRLGLQVASETVATTDGLLLISTGLQGLVISYNNATSTIKIFTKSNASQSHSLSATVPTGPADNIKIWQDRDSTGSWTGKGYAWFVSDTVIGDTDCQNIADSPVATLFTTGGGGGAAFTERGIARGVGRGVARGIRRVMENFERRPSGLWIRPSFKGVH